MPHPDDVVDQFIGEFPVCMTKLAVIVFQFSLSYSSILQAGVPIQEAMLAAEKNRTNRVTGMKQPGIILTPNP